MFHGSCATDLFPHSRNVIVGVVFGVTHFHIPFGETVPGSFNQARDATMVDSKCITRKTPDVTIRRFCLQRDTEISQHDLRCGGCRPSLLLVWDLGPSRNSCNPLPPCVVYPGENSRNAGGACGLRTSKFAPGYGAGGCEYTVHMGGWVGMMDYKRVVRFWYIGGGARLPINSIYRSTH